jgi:hypothetical protein
MRAPAVPLTDGLIDVYAICPACGYQEVAGIIDPSTWWGKGLKPADVASRCVCPQCEQPMTWAPDAKREAA